MRGGVRVVLTVSDGRHEPAGRDVQTTLALLLDPRQRPIPSFRNLVRLLDLARRNADRVRHHQRHIALLAFERGRDLLDRKSTRLNSSHANISYAVFCLKKKKITSTLSRP